MAKPGREGRHLAIDLRTQEQSASHAKAGRTRAFIAKAGAYRRGCQTRQPLKHRFISRDHHGWTIHGRVDDGMRSRAEDGASDEQQCARVKTRSFVEAKLSVAMPDVYKSPA